MVYFDVLNCLAYHVKLTEIMTDFAQRETTSGNRFLRICLLHNLRIIETSKRTNNSRFCYIRRDFLIKLTFPNSEQNPQKVDNL